MTRSTLVALVVLAFAAAPAHAVTNTFNGTTDNDWNTNTNWSQGHVPTSGEDVSISITGKNPSLSADGVANSISISASNNVTVTGHTLAIGSGASTISGQILFGSNGILTVAGTMSLTRTDPGGVLSGFSAANARIDILSGGTIDIAADGIDLSTDTTAFIHVLSGGTLKQTATGVNGGSQIEFAIDNDGQVLATAGRLLLRGGTPTGQSSNGTYNATAPASIGFQKQTDIGTSGRLTGTGTMEFNGGTGNAVTIPVNSVALPSPYDPASTFLHLGALELNSPGSTGTLTSNGGSRGGSSTLTVTGTTSVTDFGLHLTGGTTKLQGTTTIGAGTVMSGSVLELHAATALNASINIDTGSVDIASGSTLTMAANTSINAAGAGGTLHVLSGGTLVRNDAGVDGAVGVPTTNQGTIHAAGGRLRFNDDVTQTSGVTQVDALLSMQFGRTLKLQGGTIKGDGTIENDVDNSGGTVAAGASPGLLTINGNYTQGSGGTLAEEITGTAPEAFDRLLVSGVLTLGGTLAIDMSSFTPAATDTFKIISGASSRSGNFAALTGADSNGAHLSAQYDDDGVTLLTAVDPPPPPPPTTTETTPPPPTQTTPVTPPPVQQPVVPKQVPITQIVSLPSPHVCASRRHFRIHLRNHGLHPLTATVFVNGKRLKVVKGAHLSSAVDLRGLPKGTIHVRITIRYREGKALTGVRTYHTCTSKRLKGHKHRV